MGRAPCCDKENVKKGPWSPEEDTKLKTYIEQHGTGGNWIALPQKIGLNKRCGKSCRLRWLNYLRPNIKHGGFSEDEDNIICSLYMSIGSRWSIIAAQLPGRTDNDIKNYWNTRLKKKLLGKQRKEHARKGGNSSKQGNRKSTVGSSMVSSTDIDHTFRSWPGNITVLEQIPYPTDKPRFNNHASIRTLLIKLGGKFSDEGINTQSGPNTQVPVMTSYGVSHSIEAIPCCSSIDAMSVYTSQTSGFLMLPSDNNIPNELEGMGYYHNFPPRLDGSEFLYDTATGHIIDWGDQMNNQGYPPIISNFEGSLQQECGFDELRYAGVQ